MIVYLIAKSLVMFCAILFGASTINQMGNDGDLSTIILCAILSMFCCATYQIFTKLERLDEMEFVK